MYAALPVVGLGLVGAAGVASANGFLGTGMMQSQSLTSDQIATMQQNMFQQWATLLGINVEDVKNGWAQGKNLAQIAADHNITGTQLQQKMKDARLQQMKNQLQALVSQGILTQAQADQRLQYIQNNPKGLGKTGLQMSRGMGMGL